ncbi:MAG: hypothetical protein OHK0056_22200 [Bacteriovoracaceae bacterium]
MKFDYQFFIICSLGLGLTFISSCGNRDQAQLDNPNENIIKNQITAEGVLVAESQDGSGKIIRYSLPEADIIKNRDQYRATDLIEVPMHPRYNAKFFKIKNEVEFERKIFVGPKIYVYGGGENGRISLKENEDGTVNLGFNIAVVSGLKDKIISPNGNNELKLPDFTLVQNQPQLLADIQRNIGPQVELAALPGCPKRIVLNVVGEEFDANVLTQLGADYCEIDRPFNVVIKNITKNKARDILEKYIYDNQVMVEVLFETRARYQVANLKIHFDKHKIFRDLKASFGLRKGWLKADVDVHVRKVIESQSLNITLHGADSNVVQLLINQAIEKFFAPFRADPDSPDSEKCNVGTCLQLSSTKFEEASDLDVVFAQSENTLTGQHYRTSATLKPTDNRIVVNGEDYGNKGVPRGRSVELLQTAQESDIIEIIPTSYTREYREIARSSQQHDNIVCVERKRICVEAKSNFEPRPRDPRICRDECVRSQNQWTRIEQFGLQGSYFEERTHVAGNAPEIINGLSIRADFTEDGVSKSVTCPINLFQRVANGNAIQFRIENVIGCDIFSSNRNLPSLHLVNNITFPPLHHRSGTLVTRWNGNNEDHSTWEDFIPEVFFRGIVTVKNLGFNGLGNTRIDR